jgi:enoyl-CoA hydratase
LTSFHPPDEIDVSPFGAVRVVTLSRPDHLNAVNESMHNGLSVLWEQLAADPEIRVVILTGSGRAFSAGGDLDWFGELSDDPVLRERVVIREAKRIVTGMIEFPLPIIAAVNGPAVGLGCSLAAMSDIVLVSDVAYFADPHVSVGLVAGDGGVVVWPLLMSLIHAKEALFTGDRIGPHDAVRLGLANRVIEAGSLMEEAHKLAARIAAQPPAAIKGTKRAINMHLHNAARSVLDYALCAESETMTSAEHRALIRKLRTAQP